MTRMSTTTMLALLAAASMTMAGCSDEITDEPDSDAPRIVESEEETTPAPEPEEDLTARVGDSITLSANDEETEMRVAVLEVLDPLQVGEFDSPEEGNRFVGVRVRLTNTGTAPYSDSPSNGAALVTTRDENAETTFVSGGTCDDPGSLRIAPGDRRNMCLAFEMGRGSPKTFQFTLDSGFGPETGEWRLR